MTSETSAPKIHAAGTRASAVSRTARAAHDARLTGESTQREASGSRLERRETEDGDVTLGGHVERALRREGERCRLRERPAIIRREPSERPALGVEDPYAV